MRRVLAVAGHQRRIAFAVHGTERPELAQHVLRVLLKVFVERHDVALLIGEVHRLEPRAISAAAGLILQRLAQENDIGRHLCTGIFGERVIRQADSAQQVGTLCDVLAGLILRAVHKAVRHHHRHDATGAQRVHRTGKEVVVNAEA